jgi:hypothetical protein
MRGSKIAGSMFGGIGVPPLWAAGLTASPCPCAVMVTGVPGISIFEGRELDDDLFLVIANERTERRT